MDNILSKVPQWLVALSICAFLIVFIERTYIAKEPFVLFGKSFGPHKIEPSPINPKPFELTVINQRLSMLEEQSSKVADLSRELDSLSHRITTYQNSINQSRLYLEQASRYNVCKELGAAATGASNCCQHVEIEASRLFSIRECGG